MRMVNKLADRMLNALVPNITAEAGVQCQPSSWYQDCGCTSTGFRKVKLCNQSDRCVITCGPCNIVIKNETC